MNEFELLKRYIVANRFIPVPPAERNQSGSPDPEAFRKVGVSMLERLVAVGLTPQHHVLDLGCGVGRLAIPLTQYLDAEAAYFGIDINLSAIAWCHERISTVYPSFQFSVLNVRNPHYRHPQQFGQENIAQSVLPLDARRRFDFVTAFSLFTHLVWADVQWYFAEIARRLKPGGRAFTTWFLINDASRAGIKAGKGFYSFDLKGGGPTYLLDKAEGWSPAIAHDEAAILALAKSCGLRLERPARYSGWHEAQVSQDNLVFTPA